MGVWDSELDSNDPTPKKGSGKWDEEIEANSTTPTQNQSSPPSTLSNIARGAAYLGSHALSGMESGIGNIAGTFLSALDPRQALTAGADLLSGNAFTNGPRPNFPDKFDLMNVPTNAMQGVTNKIGLTNNPTLESNQPEAMRIAGGAAEGLGAALPLLTTGLGPGYLAREALTLGAAPGAAAKASNDLIPPEVAKYTTPAVSILAGLGAHHLLGGDPIGRIAESLGDSENLQQAGQAAQQSVRDWKTDLPNKIDALAAPLNAKIPAGAPTTLGETQRTLNSIANSAGTAQPLSDELVGSLPSRLANVLNKMAGGSNTVLSLPWEDVRQLRSDLGNMMANPKLMKDADPAKISDIYRAITKDLGDTANAHNAGEEWNTYNTETSKLYKAGQNVLSKISSDVNPANETLKPENIANSLLNAGKKGSTDLDVLRTHVPEAVDELASGLLKSSPEKWKTLPDSTKAALVPNDKLRSILNSSAPAPSNLSRAMAHGEAAILGTLLGEHLGSFAEHMLGQAVDPHLASLLSAAAPSVYRGAKQILSNPAMLRNPLISAEAGESVKP